MGFIQNGVNQFTVIVYARNEDTTRIHQTAQAFVLSMFLHTCTRDDVVYINFSFLWRSQTNSAISIKGSGFIIKDLELVQSSELS